jgi:hypothetical protein
MKKLLICLSAMLLPVMAMAAYNDVSLTTDAIISVGGTNLTVSGSSATIESIAVGATSFSVVLQANSSFSVSSADRNVFNTDAPAANVSQSCSDSASSLTLTDSSTSNLTVTVTLSANACGSGTTTTTSSGGNGPIVQNGGGGGGGYITPTTPVTTNTTSQQSQIAALNATLKSLQAQVGGGDGKGFTFAKNLSVGSKSSDVMNVQKTLNSDPDTMVASSGAGSPGKETTLYGPATKKAIQKFQLKYGLAKPSDSGYGNFGPKTKAKLAEVSKMKGL